MAKSSGTVSQQARGVRKFPLCTRQLLKGCCINLRWGLDCGVTVLKVLSNPIFLETLNLGVQLREGKSWVCVNEEKKAVLEYWGQPTTWRVKCVQQELAVTACLCFYFPAAFIKGLLLSESAPAWLSAAKSTIPSRLRGATGSAIPALGEMGWKPLPSSHSSSGLWPVTRNGCHIAVLKSPGRVRLQW